MHIRYRVSLRIEYLPSNASGRGAGKMEAEEKERNAENIYARPEERAACKCRRVVHTTLEYVLPILLIV